VDGAGYPDKLSGDQIPWLGRLLAVAVAFAASKLVREDAVEEIKMQAGAAFDMEAVRIFLRALPLANAPRREKRGAAFQIAPRHGAARGIYAPNGLCWRRKASS